MRGQTAQTVFARAIPQKIELKEKYAYDVIISKVLRNRRDGEPSGKLEVQVPFDGGDYFPGRAVADIDKQIKVARRGRPVHIQVGHLSITNHHKTDIETRTNIGTRETLPLKIEFTDFNQGQKRQLLSDRSGAKIELDYRPDFPKEPIVELKLRIFDEETISSLEAPSEEEIINGIVQQSMMRSDLLFLFEILLKLPTEKGGQRKAPPTLSLFALDWPVVTSKRQVSILSLGETDAEKENPKIIYNPTEQQLEYRDALFLPLENQHNGKYTHRALLPLHIWEPGELYDQRWLSGKLTVKIKRPVSGLEIDYFDAAGYRHHSDRHPKIEWKIESTVDVKYKLDLDHCFSSKIYAPGQYIYFEGVMLNAHRINDIEMLLRDMRFDTPSVYPNQNAEADQTLISTSRSEGPNRLKLWIVAERLGSETERQKEIFGGETFKTKFKTGSMILYVRGELERDNHQLQIVMGRIQKALKERFQHVRTIE